MTDKSIIYVSLLDEGTQCWRPVRVEPFGNDLYLIPEGTEVPEEETWEYQPGSIVRCSEIIFPRCFKAIRRFPPSPSYGGHARSGCGADCANSVSSVLPDTEIVPRAEMLNYQNIVNYDKDYSVGGQLWVNRNTP